MAWLVLFPALLVATYTDLRCGKIRNWLTIPLWLSGLAFAAWAGGVPAFVAAFIAGLVAASTVLPLGAGGGDVKLLLAAGAWLGLPTAQLLWACLALVLGATAVLVRFHRARWRVSHWLAAMKAELLAGLHGAPPDTPRLPGAPLILAAVILTWTLHHWKGL